MIHRNAQFAMILAYLRTNNLTTTLIELLALRSVHCRFVRWDILKPGTGVYLKRLRKVRELLDSSIGVPTVN
jgi:hypothetical protein